MHNLKPCALVATALLAGLWLISAAAGSPDRIFADGFDPCCRIGGYVSGLSGNGLVLHLNTTAINENRTISGNGPYNFAASVPSGTSWSVSVQTQPGGQACTVSNASGTITGSNIDNVDVSCGSSALIWDQGNWDSGTWQ